MTLNSYLFTSISYNILLQISFRLLSFLLNSFLIHHVSTEFIGACNFRLTLMYTTIIFLSREPFRRSLPTLNDLNTRKQNSKTIVTSLWLIVLNGCIVTFVFGYIWYFIFDEPNAQQVPSYKQSILVCCLACLIELCGEPAQCLNQIRLNVKSKFYIESVSLLAYNLTFVLLAFYLPHIGSLSFAYARLTYSFMYALLNNHQIGFKQMLPSTNANNLSKRETLDWNYLRLVRAYYFQSIFKQILTEGEKYLITIFGLLSFSESGIYDIVNNLGSLIARFLYLPIEDASFIYFTNSFKRGQTFKEQVQACLNENDHKMAAKLKQSKELFESLLKALSLLGLIICVYGQSYSKTLLYLYGGSNLSSSQVTLNMLRIYCVYVYLLGINGLTESFLNATMSNLQLHGHNYRLVTFSFVYLTFIFISIKCIHQNYGILIGNCMNMLIRIVYSLVYASKYFNGTLEISKILVSKSILLNGIFIACALLTKLSDLFNANNTLLHLMCGLFIFLFNLLAIYKYENKFLKYLIKFVKQE